MQSSASFTSKQLLLIKHERHTTAGTADRILKRVLSVRPLALNPDFASVAIVGGFIVRALRECIPCADCVAMLWAPKNSAPDRGLIAHQDHGGLFYPKQQIVKFLIGLPRFVDCIISQRWSVEEPLKVCVQRTVQELISLPILTCGNTDSDHR
ncbi:hypothetical protein HPB49_017069 [Dermacentor silvarum]|uniref:Uncharacterized protein n=1 Tax=Dermacentor silvarum TaxID=543639 RepID=A0ACB8DJV8_DERSI|nr:hypothetical protein HPB49_017069 [Dermacentor silvarum]